MVLAIDRGCTSLRVAPVRGATFLTYGSGRGPGQWDLHADAGIVRVDRDRIVEDGSLLRGLPKDTDGTYVWSHPLGHVKGDLTLAGRWPDGAFLALDEWENTGQVLGPDFYRWRTDRWERRPSDVRAQLFALVPWIDGAVLAVFYARPSGPSGFDFAVLDDARWFVRSVVPALSLEALCGSTPHPTMAERPGELFVACREGASPRVAHFSAATGRWSFDTLHSGSAPFELSNLPDDVVVMASNNKPTAIFDRTWKEDVPLPTSGLPAPASSTLSAAGGLDWAVALGGVWARPRGGVWSSLALPAGAQPVSVAEGGAGDIWVELKDGRWLRDRPLDGVYSCSTERRPGSVFERRVHDSADRGPSATGPDDWLRLYTGLATMHGASVTDAEVRGALTSDTAFEKLARKIDAPDIDRSYETLYLADVDNDGAKEYGLTYRNPTGEHNDTILGIYRPQAGATLVKVPVPIIGPSKVQLTFQSDPFLGVDPEGVTMRFDEWVGRSRRPEDRRLARYRWKGTTVRLLDRVPWLAHPAEPQTAGSR
jgi:hypothetical protein